MAVQTITYDDKSYLNQNPDIADVNKVNDTDMNMIKSVVNNNANEITSLINSLALSTTEVKTNEVWIDNKPIYKIVISGETTTSGEQVGIATNFTNEQAEVIDNIWVDKGNSFLKRPSGIVYAGVGLSTNEGYWFDIRQVNASRTTVSCMVGSNIYSGSIAYITLKYTKTTD